MLQLRRQNIGDATETEAVKWRRTRTRGELMLAHLKTIIADITEARDALMLPKKRYARTQSRVSTPSDR